MMNKCFGLMRAFNGLFNFSQHAVWKLRVSEVQLEAVFDG